MKSTPEQVVMVGDSYERDALGAQGVGVSGVLVNRWSVCRLKRPVRSSSTCLSSLTGWLRC